MKRILIGTTAALGLTFGAAGQATFTVIGPGAAVDMTPDGQFVLLTGAGGASIWSEAGGIVNIGGVDAVPGVAISDDGTVVLGELIDPDTLKNAAGLWTEATGWVSLGGLPGQPGCDANLSNPYDLSGGGDVAVGLGWEGCQGRAFRWTEATGMLDLRQLGPNSARANAISTDGLVIGGWDEAPSGPRRASIWFDDGTEELILEGLPGNAEGLGEVWGFSTDGAVAVGQAHQDLATGGGFRYLNGLVDIIPPLPGTDPVFFLTAGFAVTDDGSLVAGTNISGFGPFADRRGIIWTEGGGTEELQDILVANGVDIPKDLVIASIEAMTPDGLTMAGWAIELPFTQMAFIVSFEQLEEFEGCGELVQGVECVLFQADSGELFLLENLGGFGVGDRVFVTGLVDPDCFSFCQQEDACIFGNTIEACLDAFEDCGELVQGVECVLFQADSGGLFLLENLGGFGVGDRVFVTGLLDPDCFNICLQGDGCIFGNTIEACLDAFEGCGELVQGVECVLFQADSGGLFLLENLGGFGVGDRVFVTGLLDPDCFNICLQGDGCIFGNTIEECVDDGMITICHIPRGNPANAHEITISINALPAHLAHGDTIGPCAGVDGTQTAGFGIAAQKQGMD